MNYIINECVSLLVMSDSLWTHGLWPARLLCPWNSPGKNTWMGCHSLLQRSFSTQSLSPALLHCRKILYHLNYQGSPSVKWKCRAFFQNNEELQGSNSTALSQLRDYLRLRALHNCIVTSPWSWPWLNSYIYQRSLMSVELEKGIWPYTCIPENAGWISLLSCNKVCGNTLALPAVFSSLFSSFLFCKRKAGGFLHYVTTLL